MAMTQDAKDAVIREILLGWGDLSPGDVSLILQMIKDPPGYVETTSGSSLSSFWTSLMKLDWAEKVRSPLADIPLPVKTLCFRLTDLGIARLSRFLIFYDLVNMGASIAYRPVSTQLPPTPRMFLRSIGLLIAGLMAFAAILLALLGAGWIVSMFVFSYAVVIAALTRVWRLDGTLQRGLTAVVAVNVVLVVAGVMVVLTR